MTQVDVSMEKEKYIILSMDKMKIQADLVVYDKRTGKIYYTMQACNMH